MNVVKPPSEEKSLLALRRLYENAERDIIKVITRKRSLDQVDYAEVAALERVQTILTNMQTEAGEYIPQMVEKYFYDETKKDMSGYENALSLTSTQTNITQLLTNNLLGELMAASETCFSSAARFYTLGRLEADEYRKAALEGVMTHEASTEGWYYTQRKMAAKLNAQGITCFVDKAGRNWSLESYCSMATRTTARQAEVAASITADDHDLWQIVRIGSTCPLCAVYEGRVYSKSGTNPDYPSLAMAFGKIDPEGPNGLENTYLNIHPNCLHSLIKYTTIGKSDEQIQKDKDFSSFEKNPATVDPRTKKQREAYRKKEANRRKYIEDLNQWRKYRAALGKDVPAFEKFREAKINGSETYRNLEHKYRSFSIKASKAVDIPREDGIIKATQEKAGTGLARHLDVDFFNEQARRENILPEVSDVITTTIVEYERKGGLYFSEVEFVQIPKVHDRTPLFETDVNRYGLTVLRVNTEVLGGMNLAQVDEIVRATAANLPRNLREAVIHECGHAKSYNGKTPFQIQEMLDELKDVHIEGVSLVAESDGAECIAETEVLLSRGERPPEAAMELYRKYARRGGI